MYAFTTAREAEWCTSAAAQLKGLASREPRASAQAIVIHEALHTLGLGENPPSSTGDHAPEVLASVSRSDGGPRAAGAEGGEK